MGGFGGGSVYCRLQGLIGVLVGRPACRRLPYWPEIGAVMGGGMGWVLGPRSLRPTSFNNNSKYLWSQSPSFK